MLTITVPIVGWSAPRLTCMVLHGKAPFAAGELVIRGAGFGNSPPAAMVVATCDPTTFHAICAGASERWLPSLLFAEGQHAWGTFLQAPAVTWRIDLDAQARTPTITGTVPALLVEQWLAATLRREQAPVDDVRIHALEITGSAQPDQSMQWQIHLAGSALVALGQQQLPLRIDEARGSVQTWLGNQPIGGRGLHAELHVTTLRGMAPYLGDLAALREVIQKQGNQYLGQELPNILVPDWWPIATGWDLRTVPSAVTEF